MAEEEEDGPGPAEKARQVWESHGQTVFDELDSAEDKSAFVYAMLDAMLGPGFRLEEDWVQPLAGLVLENVLPKAAASQDVPGSVVSVRRTRLAFEVLRLISGSKVELQVVDDAALRGVSSVSPSAGASLTPQPDALQCRVTTEPAGCPDLHALLSALVAARRGIGAQLRQAVVDVCVVPEHSAIATSIASHMAVSSLFSLQRLVAKIRRLVRGHSVWTQHGGRAAVMGLLTQLGVPPHVAKDAVPTFAGKGDLEKFDGPVARAISGTTHTIGSAFRPSSVLKVRTRRGSGEVGGDGLVDGAAMVVDRGAVDRGAGGGEKARELIPVPGTPEWAHGVIAKLPQDTTSLKPLQDEFAMAVEKGWSAAEGLATGDREEELPRYARNRLIQWLADGHVLLHGTPMVASVQFLLGAAVLDSVGAERSDDPMVPVEAERIVDAALALAVGGEVGADAAATADAGPDPAATETPPVGKAAWGLPRWVKVASVSDGAIRLAPAPNRRTADAPRGAATAGPEGKEAKEEEKDEHVRENISIEQLPLPYYGASAHVDARACWEACSNLWECFVMEVEGQRHLLWCPTGDGSSQKNSAEEGHVNSVSAGFQFASSGDAGRILGGGHLTFFTMSAGLYKESDISIDIHMIPALHQWAKLSGDVQRAFDAELNQEKKAKMTLLKSFLSPLDYKMIWQVGGGGKSSQAECDDPSNNLPKSLAQLKDATTGNRYFYAFANITCAQEVGMWAADITEQRRKYRNIVSRYRWPTEKYELMHGPLHSLGRSCDPLWERLLLVLALTTKQLKEFTVQHLGGCLRHNWEHRFKVDGDKFTNMGSVGINKTVTMNPDLWPYKCATCKFGMPNDSWRTVWWLVRTTLRAWRISRRVVLTRDIMWQKEQTKLVAAACRLYDSCLSLLLDGKGDTITNRHYSSKFPYFLARCNDINVSVASLSEASIEREHLEVQRALEKSGNWGRSRHMADRERGRTECCTQVLIDAYRTREERGGEKGDQGTRIAQGIRRNRVKQAKLASAQAVDQAVFEAESESSAMQHHDVLPAAGAAGAGAAGTGAVGITDWLEPIASKVGDILEDSVEGYVTTVVGEDGATTYQSEITVAGTRVAFVPGATSGRAARAAALQEAMVSEALKKVIKDADDAEQETEAARAAELEARRVAAVESVRDKAEKKQEASGNLSLDLSKIRAGTYEAEASPALIVGIEVDKEFRPDKLHLSRRRTDASDMLILESSPKTGLRGFVVAPAVIKIWFFDDETGLVRFKLLVPVSFVTGPHRKGTSNDYSGGEIRMASEIVLTVAAAERAETSKHMTRAMTMSPLLREIKAGSLHAYRSVLAGFDREAYEARLNATHNRSRFLADPIKTGDTFAEQFLANIKEFVHFGQGKQTIDSWQCPFCGKVAKLALEHPVPQVPGHTEHGILCPQEEVYLLPFISDEDEGAPEMEDDDDGDVAGAALCPGAGCQRKSKSLCGNCLLTKLRSYVRGVETVSNLTAKQRDALDAAKKWIGDLPKKKNTGVLRAVARDKVIKATQDFFAACCNIQGRFSVRGAAQRAGREEKDDSPAAGSGGRGGRGKGRAGQVGARRGWEADDDDDDDDDEEEGGEGAEAGQAEAGDLEMEPAPGGVEGKGGEGQQQQQQVFRRRRRRRRR